MNLFFFRHKSHILFLYFKTIQYGNMAYIYFFRINVREHYGLSTQISHDFRVIFIIALNHSQIA